MGRSHSLTLYNEIIAWPYNFPSGSINKECTCTGDPDSISRGRSPGEGIGSPLQYSYLGSLMGRGAWQAPVHRVARVRNNLATKPPTPPTTLLCALHGCLQRLRKINSFAWIPGKGGVGKWIQVWLIALASTAPFNDYTRHWTLLVLSQTSWGGSFGADLPWESESASSLRILVCLLEDSSNWFSFCPLEPHKMSLVFSETVK